MAPDSSAGSLRCGVPACSSSPGWVPCRQCPRSIPPRCTSPSPAHPVEVSRQGSKPLRKEMLVAAIVATSRHGSQMSPARGLQRCPTLVETPASPCWAAAALHQPEPQAWCSQLVQAHEGILPTARAPGGVEKPNRSQLTGGHQHY